MDPIAIRLIVSASHLYVLAPRAACISDTQKLELSLEFRIARGHFLLIMIATGIVLAMHYVPTGEGAFRSVEHIMRDVNYGWLIRYIHTTGASMFFAVVYIPYGQKIETAQRRQRSNIFGIGPMLHNKLAVDA